MRRSMSALSRASTCRAEATGEGWGSIVSMHFPVGHGLLDVFVQSQRDLLHFGEITFPLLRRHRAADFGKMFEHLRLAFRAKLAELGQFLLRFSRDVCSVAQRSGNFF